MPDPLKSHYLSDADLADALRQYEKQPQLFGWKIDEIKEEIGTRQARKPTTVTVSIGEDFRLHASAAGKRRESYTLFPRPAGEAPGW